MTTSEAQWAIQIFEYVSEGKTTSEITIYGLGDLVPTYIFKRVTHHYKDKSHEYFFIENIHGDSISIDTEEFKGIQETARELIDELLLANPVTYREPETQFHSVNPTSLEIRAREMVTSTKVFPDLEKCRELEFIIKSPREGADILFRCLAGEGLFPNKVDAMDA